MTKAPRPGQVKTRLIPPFTAAEAAALNRCFLHDTMNSISLAAKDLARGIAVYTPVDAKGDYAGIVPTGFDLIPQRGESLGERVIFAMEDLFRLGFASVCLINSDSPTVPARVFTEAASVLAQPGETLVLGPSSDGGYYLVGLNKPTPKIFADIAWSTDRVLDQTIARARQMNLKIHQLLTWYDVDDRKTLRLLCEEFFSPHEGATAGYAAPATRDYLEALLKREGRERIWPCERRSGSSSQQTSRSSSKSD
jgi:rSAM/selenodomain-associated transferase 1